LWPRGFDRERRNVGGYLLQLPGSSVLVAGEDDADVKHHSQREAKAQGVIFRQPGIAPPVTCLIAPGFSVLTETETESLIMALIGLIFCVVVDGFATNI
jgi:hypothetical protein